MTLTHRLPLALAAATLLANIASAAAPAQQPALPIPPAGEMLKTLKKEHPRLLASAQDFARIKQASTKDAQTQKWKQEVHDQGQRILKEPPSKYEIPDGLRLLSTSRRVLQRMYCLAMLYRLEGDQRYLERAWRELDAAGHFQDWNPRHFLDTAEMTHAFAIAYDWLYDAWTPKQREFIKEALIEKGLKLGVNAHRGTGRYGWWVKAHHNWNQVCNGGIGMGALAVADEQPELAGEFLHAALISLQLPMACFAPDGAWNEGPGYWHYATTYNVAILAALQTALGTDFGLSKMQGFAEAGMFPIYASGPFGHTFNYADAHEGRIRASQLFWMANQFDRPAYAAWQLRSMNTAQPLDLLWFRNPAGGDSALSALPLNKYFREAEVVTLRSAWNDPDALFVGFKAGDNKANHSHLDLGSFVLDALGVRWAVDLGSDNYNFPGYFGNQRWNYYRLRAEGHNTLLINAATGPDQDPRAMTRITRFEPNPKRAFAIADLTPAYAKEARQVSRGLALLDGRQVLVQDEIQTAAVADIWWFLHTPAQIKLLDATTAILSQGNARLCARLLSPSKAAFSMREAAPLPGSPHPEKQGENKRVRKLAINIKDAASVRLAVLLTPLRPGEALPAQSPQLTPLASW